MAEIITEIDGKREDDNSPAITDHYIIFNRCSQFNVRVRGKTIDALGDFDSPFGKHNKLLVKISVYVAS